MLLMMLDRGLQIDCVLWADTGMEFPEMYKHIEKLDAYLFRIRGLHITRLKSEHSFEWFMFEEPRHKEKSIEQRKEKGVSILGNGWPGIKVRWCTGQLKTHLIEKALKPLKEHYYLRSYIGIAYDERERCKDGVYPLVKWQITEKMALQYCYKKGFDWDGLYEIYFRCSCWCCPFQRIEELRKMRTHHPELWQKLLDMDKRAISQFGVCSPLGVFKENWTVEKLEQRFAEEEQINGGR